jgi:hypothetical protein
MYVANTKFNSGAVYRKKYLDYLFSNWGREMTGEGMMHMGQARQMKKITEEYWNQITDTSTSTFDMSADVDTSIDETPPTRKIMTPSGALSIMPSKMTGIGLKEGRFRLR